MDCLVTGGAGFIGSNLVDALVGRGDRVTVLDNLFSGKRANSMRRSLAGATLHEVDVRDAEAVAGCSLPRGPRWCSTWQPRSTSGCRSRMRRWTPAPTCSGTIAVLDAALGGGSRRIVNTSTGGGLYGERGSAADA